MKDRWFDTDIERATVKRSCATSPARDPQLKKDWFRQPTQRSGGYKAHGSNRQTETKWSANAAVSGTRHDARSTWGHAADAVERCRCCQPGTGKNAREAVTRSSCNADPSMRRMDPTEW